MVDIDGDGLISYEEYMLFRTLLSLPRRKVYEALANRPAPPHNALTLAPMPR